MRAACSNPSPSPARLAQRPSSGPAREESWQSPRGLAVSLQHQTYAVRQPVFHQWDLHSVNVHRAASSQLHNRSEVPVADVIDLEEK